VAPRSAGSRAEAEPGRAVAQGMQGKNFGMGDGRVSVVILEKFATGLDMNCKLPSRLLLPVFSFGRVMVLMVLLLCAHALPAQFYFGKQYIDGYTMKTFGVRGPGTDYWMMRGMFDFHRSSVRFSRLDSVGEPIASYVPEVPGGEEIEGRDLIYMPQDQALTAIGQGAGDSLSPEFQWTGIILQWNDAGGVNYLNAVQRDSFSVFFYGVDSCTAGSLVASGAYGRIVPALDQSDGLIARFRAQDGGLICTAGFGGQGNDQLGDVAKVPGQNQIVAVGSAEGFGAVETGVYVVSVDTNCNKLWSLMLDGPGDEGGYNVLVDDSGILIFGSTNSFASYGQCFVARMSLSGVLLGFQVLDIMPATGCWMNEAVILPNGNYLISGTNSYSWGMYAELDSNLTVQWVRRKPDWSFHQSMTVDTATSSLYVWTITEAIGTSQTDGALFRMGLNGTGFSGCNFQTVSTFSSTAGSVSNLSTVGDDHPTQVMDRFVTVNSVGDTLRVEDACGFYVHVEPNADFDIAVEPQPAVDRVKVRFVGGLMADGQYWVSDMAGRMVLQGDVAVGMAEMELDIAALPAGVYGLEVVTGDVRRGVKVVKVGW
jgi:hypothetical protein